MTFDLRLISTDFDGTIHEDFADAPVPDALQDRLARLQEAGTLWVINTGRDLASLLESMGRAHMRVRPNYIVAVEREIFKYAEHRYEPVEPWHTRCHRDHAELFGSLAIEIGDLMRHLSSKYDATFYSDAWSPLCVIARNNTQMDAIQVELDAFTGAGKDLVSVRNDVYVRLSHRGYSKGSALREIAQLHGIQPSQTFAAGDHFNDVPMLDRAVAHWLASPVNAMPSIKAQVLSQGGYVALKPCGHGVLEALDHFTATHGASVPRS